MRALPSSTIDRKVLRDHIHEVVVWSGDPAVTRKRITDTSVYKRYEYLDAPKPKYIDTELIRKPARRVYVRYETHHEHDTAYPRYHDWSIEFLPYEDLQRLWYPNTHVCVRYFDSSDAYPLPRIRYSDIRPVRDRRAVYPCWYFVDTERVLQPDGYYRDDEYKTPLRRADLISIKLMLGRSSVPGVLRECAYQFIDWLLMSSSAAETRAAITAELAYWVDIRPCCNDIIAALA